MTQNYELIQHCCVDTTTLVTKNLLEVEY